MICCLVAYNIGIRLKSCCGTLLQAVMKIETKKLGRTVVDVPVIGMGTWQIGGSYSPDYSDDQKAIESLKTGIELGLTLIDTAEMYGAGHSEELVGKAVKGKREKVFIASKVLPEHLSYDAVLIAAQRSLRHLDSDYIDLYQVHAPNLGIPIKETMKAMEHLVEEGLIRFIGVSNFSAKLLREAQECLSKYQIVSNQVEYNLLYRGIERDLLPFAERESITIIAYSPFSIGHLFNYSGRGVEILRQLASKYNKTIAQICLNWLIAKKPVIAIPKAIDITHLRENAGAAGWRMEPEDYSTIGKVFA